MTESQGAEVGRKVQAQGTAKAKEQNLRLELSSDHTSERSSVKVWDPERPLCAEPQGQAKVKGRPWEKGLKQEGGRVRGVEPQERKTPASQSLCCRSHGGCLLGAAPAPSSACPTPAPAGPLPGSVAG